MSDFYDTDDVVVSQLVKARTALIYQQPLLGEIALGLNLIILESDNWCERAATDGRSIYFNRNFVISLFYDTDHVDTRMNGHKRLVAILLHEIWHVVLGHLLRKQNRDADYWNMAVDYIVNAMIVKSEIGLLPELALLDRRFTVDHTADEVYEYLYTNQVEKKETLDVHIGQSPESGEGKQNQHDDVTDMVKASTQQRPAGGIWAEEGATPPEPMSADETQQATAHARLALVRAAQEEASGAGTLPGGLQRQIADIIAPRMDWRQLLNSSLRSIEPCDYTYDDLSEVSWASFLYHRRIWNPKVGFPKGFCAILPTQTEGERVEVTIAIDTSASVSARMISEFMNEIIGIMESFHEVEVRIICFDAKVHSVDVFAKSELTKLREFKKKKIKGGGGTNFGPVWDYLKKEKIVPDRLIIATDGEPSGSWGDEKYCSTIFLIADKAKRKIAPFGTTAYLA